VEKGGGERLLHLWTPVLESIWTQYLDVYACVCSNDMGRGVELLANSQTPFIDSIWTPFLDVCVCVQ